MYSLEYPMQYPTDKVVLDYRSVYVKLHDFLTNADYAGGYSNYTQDEFDNLVPDLLASYFSVDAIEGTQLLYSVLADQRDTPDYCELLLGDRALSIIEEIDSITKRHFPGESRFGLSPFDTSAIVKIKSLGPYRIMLEIRRGYLSQFKIEKETQRADRSAY